MCYNRTLATVRLNSSFPQCSASTAQLVLSTQLTRNPAVNSKVRLVQMLLQTSILKTVWWKPNVKIIYFSVASPTSGGRSVDIVRLRIKATEFVFCLWLYSPLFGLDQFFSFLIFYAVGRTPWTGEQPVAVSLPAHRTAQTQNKLTQTSMPHVGFEPTIPVFERVKTVHALDRAATAIGVKTFECY
jgi:hypothetical protein